MGSRNDKITSMAFDELAEDLDMGKLPQEERDQMLSELSEVVLGRVFVELMEKIGEEGRAEYEKFIADRDPSSEQIRGFFESKVDNFNVFVDKVIEEMRSEMLHGAE